MNTQLGMQEYFQNNLDISIYPTLFPSKIYIAGIKEKSLIEIFDITGKLVFSDLLYLGKNCIDLNIESIGIY